MLDKNFPTLVDVTPAETGQSVRDAQWLLSGHNRWSRNFDPGPVDGMYGLLTAKAAYRAKYWLGYKSSNLNYKFGPYELGYLLPLDSEYALKLTPGMLAVRQHRLAMWKQNHTDIRELAFRVAMSYVGYQGTGTNGVCSYFGQWYGQQVGDSSYGCANWCAMFDSYCIHKAGGKFLESYVPTIVSKARLDQDGLAVIATPHRGVLVTYDWNHDGIADHIEFFDQWFEPGVSFMAVGGNTGTTNGGSGGQVLHQLRFVSTVESWVNYGSTSS